MISIHLEQTQVHAGGTITGWISSDKVAKGGEIRIHLTHTEPRSQNNSCHEAIVIPVPRGVLDPGERVPFTYRLPDWLVASFDGQKVSSKWGFEAWFYNPRMVTFGGHAQAEFEVLPNPAGTTIKDTRSGDTEWRRVRKHWERRSTHAGNTTLPMHFALRIVVFLSPVCLIALKGGVGVALALLAVVLAFNLKSAKTLWRAHVATRQGQIRITGVPSIAEPGQWISVGLETDSPRTVTVTLWCTEWSFRSGVSDDAEPTVLHEQRVEAVSPGVAKLQIPSRPYPSMAIRLASIQWDIRVQHGDQPEDGMPAAAAHMVVLSRFRDYGESPPSPSRFDIRSWLRKRSQS